jgi:hypothetical protein
MVPQRTPSDPFLAEIRAVGFGNVRLGGTQPLVDEPLDIRDWQEIHHAYIAMIEHVRLVVARARVRAKQVPHESS